VDHVVGIDLGTSAVKVLVLAADGSTVAKARAGYDLEHPAPDRTEQSVASWWRAVCEATREALGGVDPRTVRSVGLSGQLNALVLLGEDLEPLEHAWIWLDLRAREQARTLNDRHADLLRRATVNPASPIYVAAKLAWLRDERPDLAARVHKVAFAKDVVNYRLTGHLATDHTDASCSLLYDLRGGRWSPALLDVAGVRADQLPPLRASNEVIGSVTAQAAAATGLPEGVAVVAGAGDVAALALGSGTSLPGTCSVTLGTAGHVVSARRDITPAGYGRVWQMRHALPDVVLQLGLVMSGGLCLSWFAREFGPRPMAGDDRASPIEALLAELPGSRPGARGVTFLPFLEGAATPYQDPDLAAGFVGLRTHHLRADALQAVLEGVAYNVRDCVEVFEDLGSSVQHVRLSEGGSRSPAWCQIIADVLQRPVTTLREIDSSALGAALLALSAARGEGLAAVVERITHGLHERTFEPDTALRERYDAGYARYAALVAAVQSVG
jgi:xylulokinase